MNTSQAVNTSKSIISPVEVDRPGLIALLPRVRALARCLCGDPARADRLTKATLDRAVGNLKSPEPGADLEAWLFTMVLDCHRGWTGPSAKPGGAVFVVRRSASDIGDLGRALLKLPLSQREALALVDAAGRSYEDAAAICGCAPGTIGSRVSRGRSRLSAILADARASHERRIPDRTMAVLLAAVRARAGAVV